MFIILEKGVEPEEQAQLEFAPFTSTRVSAVPNGLLRHRVQQTFKMHNMRTLSIRVLDLPISALHTINYKSVKSVKHNPS